MAEKRKMKNEASSSNTKSDDSVVVDVGRRRSSCGYCKSSSNTSITHGLWAHSLTVYDYQALLDRGWRRSGCFLYKPEMEKTCCPSYTIRMKAADFVPSKEQVRVSKRMQRFLDGSLNVKKPDEQIDTSIDSNHISNNDSVSSVQPEIDQVINYLSDQIDSGLLACTERGEFPSDIQFPKASVKRVAPTKRKLQAEGPQDLLYSSNISFQIAAALRRANKTDFTHKDPKFIAEVLSSHLANTASAIGLLVKACNGHINFYSTEAQTQLNAMIARPTISKESSSSDSGKVQIKRRSLEIRLNRSTFDPEEYALYRKYQIKVHNDTPAHVTETSYKRFLIDSPLVFVPPNGDNIVPPCGFGSFHQQYLIDGKLVAVGVIDILPKCLSSKYLFWDPDFAFLSLGKYSALQEINWVKENQSHCPTLQYYYLGYYIHSCNKMRYKAAYRPSELLCPLRYQFAFHISSKEMATEKSKILIIGGTGYVGKFVVEASAKAGHSTFILVREITTLDPVKGQLIESFKNLGVTLVYGDLYDHESLVKAIKQVDVVISTVGKMQIPDQTKIIAAIKEAGNVKRFLPSEFGMDVDHQNAIEPACSTFAVKVQIRRTIEAEGIPFTCVACNCFAGAFLTTLAQPGAATSPPRDKVTIFGDGTPKAVFNDEHDIGTYTIKAVDDPRTLNKILYIKPPKNICSLNEVVSLWEKKIGKSIEKTYVPEEQLLKLIQESTFPTNIALAIGHSIFVKGDLTNFEIDPQFGVEATELYPDVKYTTVDEYLDRFV